MTQLLTRNLAIELLDHAGNADLLTSHTMDESDLEVPPLSSSPVFTLLLFCSLHPPPFLYSVISLASFFLVCVWCVYVHVVHVCMNQIPWLQSGFLGYNPDSLVTIRIPWLQSGFLGYNPDSLVIVLGDFNKGNLTQELPKYKQFIKCPTREGNTLDHSYSTISKAYHAVPRAALGHSDHTMVHLIPAYRQKLKRCKPAVI